MSLPSKATKRTLLHHPISCAVLSTVVLITALFSPAVAFATRAALSESSSGTYQVASEDVYNFYFQKGSAPNTVIQGGSGQTAKNSETPAAVAPETPASQPATESPTVAPSSTPSAPQNSEEKIQPIVARPPNSSLQVRDTTEPASSLIASSNSNQSLSTEMRTHAPVAVRDPEFKSIYLLGGLAQVNDEAGTGLAYTLGAQYNFNRYVGVRLQGQMLAPEDANYKRVLNDKEDQENIWGGQVLVAITPLRIQLLGHRFIDLSANAGIMTSRHLITETNQAGYENNSVKLATHGFVGASALVAVNENFALEAYAAVQRGGNFSHLGANLVVQF
jgi:hypothetical protein